MKEVTKEEFYKRIRESKHDVVYSPQGDTHPYVGYFKYRNGGVFGVVKPSERDPKKYPDYPWRIERYYINE